MEGEPTASAGCDEVSLAERILAGDRAAEHELVSNYRRGILAIATARTRDREAARDLTQDVLIAVLKALRNGKLREFPKLSAFIQGTAHNLINNYIRERTRRPEHELNDLEITGVDPVEDMELSERRNLVRRELQSFSLIDQQILLLSLVDGHSLAEVAQKVGLSYDAARARKSRTIKKITKKFAHLSHK